MKDQLSQILSNTIINIDRNMFDKNILQITETLLYGDCFLDYKISFLSARDLTSAVFKLNIAVCITF